MHIMSWDFGKYTMICSLLVYCMSLKIFEKNPTIMKNYRIWHYSKMVLLSKCTLRCPPSFFMLIICTSTLFWSSSIFVVLFENWDMETKKFASKNVAFFLILWLYRIKVWDSEPLLIGLIFSCLRSFNWEACLVMVYMITRCLSKTLSFFPLVILYFYRFCKQLLATPDHTI